MHACMHACGGVLRPVVVAGENDKLVEKTNWFPARYHTDVVSHVPRKFSLLVWNSTLMSIRTPFSRRGSI